MMSYSTADNPSLEAELLHGLTPEQESKLPAEMLNQARENIRAKIREGLVALDRGKVVDGEEFFSFWRKRLQMLAKDTPSD